MLRQGSFEVNKNLKRVSSRILFVPVDKIWGILCYRKHIKDCAKNSTEY